MSAVKLKLGNLIWGHSRKQGAQKNREERAQKNREERAARWGVDNNNIKDRIAELTDKELREALEEYGLSTEGDIKTLQTRLFNDVILKLYKNEDEDEDEDEDEESSVVDKAGKEMRLEALRSKIRSDYNGGKSRRRRRHHKRKTHKHKRGKKSHKRKHNKTSRKRHKSRKHRYHR